jgi:hypothetical protein
MDFAGLARFVGIAGAVVVAARRWFSVSAALDTLRQDIGRNLDLHDRLPHDCGARQQLLSHIENQVELLIAQEQIEKRVDVRGIVLGLLLLAGAAALAYRIVATDWSGGWWAAVILLATIGAVGFAQDVVPQERDERGRPVRSSRQQP